MNIDKNGYYSTPSLGLIHRHTYQLHHGKIPKGWIVHHLDSNKLNNEISNLISMPHHCHDVLHGYQRKIKRLLTREETQKFVTDYINKTKEMEQEVRRLQRFIKTTVRETIPALREEIRKRKKHHFQ